MNVFYLGIFFSSLVVGLNAPEIENRRRDNVAINNGNIDNVAINNDNGNGNINNDNGNGNRDRDNINNDNIPNGNGNINNDNGNINIVRAMDMAINIIINNRRDNDNIDNRRDSEDTDEDSSDIDENYREYFLNRPSIIPEENRRNRTNYEPFYKEVLIQRKYLKALGELEYNNQALIDYNKFALSFYNYGMNIITSRSRYAIIITYRKWIDYILLNTYTFKLDSQFYSIVKDIKDKIKAAIEDTSNKKHLSSIINATNNILIYLSKHKNNISKIIYCIDINQIERVSNELVEYMTHDDYYSLENKISKEFSDLLLVIRQKYNMYDNIPIINYHHIWDILLDMYIAHYNTSLIMGYIFQLSDYTKGSGYAYSVILSTARLNTGNYIMGLINATMALDENNYSIRELSFRQQSTFLIYRCLLMSELVEYSTVLYSFYFPFFYSEYNLDIFKMRKSMGYLFKSLYNQIVSIWNNSFSEQNPFWFVVSNGICKIATNTIYYLTDSILLTIYKIVFNDYKTINKLQDHMNIDLSLLISSINAFVEELSLIVKNTKPIHPNAQLPPCISIYTDLISILSYLPMIYDKETNELKDEFRDINETFSVLMPGLSNYIE
ncbi:hypothetical protein NEOKW01_1428 [Nematocida sp. AWRm80]|nr:hypothetical protein NEOKW01_1428 [Nematocida sp. AWRm80]